MKDDYDEICKLFSSDEINLIIRLGKLAEKMRIGSRVSIKDSDMVNINNLIDRVLPF